MTGAINQGDDRLQHRHNRLASLWPLVHHRPDDFGQRSEGLPGQECLSSQELAELDGFLDLVEDLPDRVDLGWPRSAGTKPIQVGKGLGQRDMNA